MGMDPKGYYELLGLEAGASIEECRKKYSSLQKKYHPDGLKAKALNKIADPNEREKKKKEFKEISLKLNSAKQTLLDPKNKEEYDNPPQNDIFDLFSMFRGGGGQQQRKVSDTKAEIKISFKESFLGKNCKFNVSRNKLCCGCNGKGGDRVETCKRCQGKGKIVYQVNNGPFGTTLTESVCDLCRGEKSKIIGKKCGTCSGKKYINEKFSQVVNLPPGVSNGEKISFRGKGDEKLGCITGDLIFTVKIINDNKYQRKANHIISNIDVDIFTALVGGKVYFKHLDDKIIEINIPKVNNFNNHIVVRREGFRVGNIVGDLYLKPNFIINNNINIKKLQEVLPNVVIPPKNTDKKSIGTYTLLPNIREEEEENDQHNPFSSFTSFFTRNI